MFALESPVLNVAIDAVSKVEGEDALCCLLHVFSKCKDNLQDGPRLENMCWRLWHRERSAHSQMDSPLCSPLLPTLSPSIPDEWTDTESCSSYESASSDEDEGTQPTHTIAYTTPQTGTSDSGSGTIVGVSRSPERQSRHHHHHHHGHAEHTCSHRPRRTASACSAMTDAPSLAPAGEDTSRFLKRNNTSSSSMHTDRSRTTAASTSFLLHRMASPSPHRLSTPSMERRPSLASRRSHSTSTHHPGKIMAELIPSKLIVSSGKPNGARITFTSDRDRSSALSLSTLSEDATPELPSTPPQQPCTIVAAADAEIDDTVTQRTFPKVIIVNPTPHPTPPMTPHMTSLPSSGSPPTSLPLGPPWGVGLVGRRDRLQVPNGAGSGSVACGSSPQAVKISQSATVNDAETADGPSSISSTMPVRGSPPSMSLINHRHPPMLIVPLMPLTTTSSPTDSIAKMTATTKSHDREPKFFLGSGRDSVELGSMSPDTNTSASVTVSTSGSSLQTRAGLRLMRAGVAMKGGPSSPLAPLSTGMIGAGVAVAISPTVAASTKLKTSAHEDSKTKPTRTGDVNNADTIQPEGLHKNTEGVVSSASIEPPVQRSSPPSLTTGVAHSQAQFESGLLAQSPQDMATSPASTSTRSRRSFSGRSTRSKSSKSARSKVGKRQSSSPNPKAQIQALEKESAVVEASGSNVIAEPEKARSVSKDKSRERPHGGAKFVLGTVRPAVHRLHSHLGHRQHGHRGVPSALALRHQQRDSLSSTKSGTNLVGMLTAGKGKKSFNANERSGEDITTSISASRAKSAEKASRSTSRSRVGCVSSGLVGRNENRSATVTGSGSSAPAASGSVRTQRQQGSTQGNGNRNHHKDRSVGSTSDYETTDASDDEDDESWTDASVVDGKNTNGRRGTRERELQLELEVQMPPQLERPPVQRRHSEDPEVARRQQQIDQHALRNLQALRDDAQNNHQNYPRYPQQSHHQPHQAQHLHISQGQRSEPNGFIGAVLEAQRQRDLFAKVDRRSYTNLQRSESGLSVLFHPDPERFPENHPYRYSRSTHDILAIPRPGRFGGVASGNAPGPVSGMGSGSGLAQQRQGQDQRQEQGAMLSMRQQLQGLGRPMMNTMKKSAVAGPVADTVNATGSSVRAEVAGPSQSKGNEGEGTSNSAGRAPRSRSSLRLKGKPEGEMEMEESDSGEDEDVDNTIQMSSSLAVKRLQALGRKADAMMRGSEDRAGGAVVPPPGHAQLQQQQQRRVTQPEFSTRAESSGQISHNDYFQQNHHRPHHSHSHHHGQDNGPSQLTHVATAPIPLGYPYNLPAPMAPSSPRTTRRNMLSHELSESLRRNLLWERQVSKQRPMGVAPRRQGMVRPMTAINVTTAGATTSANGNGNGNGNATAGGSGAGLGRTRDDMEGPTTADNLEERKRKAMARNKSWADEYHGAGW